MQVFLILQSKVLWYIFIWHDILKKTIQKLF